MYHNGIGALGESRDEVRLLAGEAERKVTAANAAVVRNPTYGRSINGTERIASLRDRLKLVKRAIEDSWALFGIGFGTEIKEIDSIKDEADAIVAEISALLPGAEGPATGGEGDLDSPDFGGDGQGDDRPLAEEGIPWLTIAAVVGVGIVLTAIARKTAR